MFILKLMLLFIIISVFENYLSFQAKSKETNKITESFMRISSFMGQ